MLIHYSQRRVIVVVSHTPVILYFDQESTNRTTDSSTLNGFINERRDTRVSVNINPTMKLSVFPSEL